MIINIIRLILAIVLIAIIIFDVKVSKFFNNPYIQLLIALVILFVLIFIEESIGFLLGLIFLIIYFKYYRSLLNNKTVKYDNFNNIKDDKNNKNSFPYISPELLESAQNNIVDIKNYKEGFNSSEIQGFDKKDNYNNL
jgi:Ca2+/Na+ antiporter